MVDILTQFLQFALIRFKAIVKYTFEVADIHNNVIKAVLSDKMINLLADRIRHNMLKMISTKNNCTENLNKMINLLLNY